LISEISDEEVIDSVDHTSQSATMPPPSARNPISGVRKLRQIRSALLLRVSALEAKQCLHPDDHVEARHLTEKVAVVEEENAGVPKP
jgi:hypothetical protein